MKITKRQLRRIIRESKGWFLLGADGTLAKSQKTRTPIWWSDEAGAKKAYDSGYGGEGAVPVEILLAPDHYAYNGSNADPADLESVRQHLGESKMKITKKQLRRIIKEEKKRLLKEQMDDDIKLGDYLEIRISDDGYDISVEKVNPAEYKNQKGRYVSSKFLVKVEQIADYGEEEY
jgi:hypothetical protein